MPVLSLGLGDSLSVGSGTNKLYNDKWWPQHCESVLPRQPDSVVTNFDSTPKQPEQHDNNQGFLSAFMPTLPPPNHQKKKNLSWMGLQVSSGIEIVFFFLLGLKNYIRNDQSFCRQISCTNKPRTENSVWRRGVFDRPLC